VEEDIFERKSAGLGAANARRIDRRPGEGPPIDDADRDAARALRGLKKKKKKKKPSEPWHHQKWAKAAALSGCLLAIILGVYLAVRPPSAEKLAGRIDAATSEPDRLEASEKYLANYGNMAGPDTDKAAKVFRDARIHKREKQLANRFGVAKWKEAPEEGDDPTAYSLAMNAIQAEKDGRLANAQNFWNQVKSIFPEEGKLPFTFDDGVLKKALWGWVAEKRIRDIDEARKQDAELDAVIAANRNNEKPMPFDSSNARSLAIRARRLEQIGDTEKAARTWDTLLALPDKEPDHGMWLLLAGEHRSKLKDSPVKRPELLAKLVRDADRSLGELRKNKQASALDWKILRAGCRDLVELYDDETDKPLVESVARAKQILNEASKEK
jgi:hypothetical protein